jgi:hypothetical protein
MAGRRNPARAAAIVCWVYAACWGLPAIPVGVFIMREHRLPWLWGLFPMYGGPWRRPLSEAGFLATLAGFFVLCTVMSVGAWRLWTGRRSGAVVVLATLPVEAIFWWGYALPIPPLFGLVRLVLVVAAWPGLGRGPDRSTTVEPGQSQTRVRGTRKGRT